jgi:MFS-type transporter involved in bile tolerance (Atg22 family)
MAILAIIGNTCFWMLLLLVTLFVFALNKSTNAGYIFVIIFWFAGLASSSIVIGKLLWNH